MNGGERWPDVVAPPQGWDENDERWKRAAPILARPHTLKCRGRQWRCEACGKHASDGALKAKLARTKCVEHPATTLGEQARQVSPPSSEGQIRVVLLMWSDSSQVRKEDWRAVCGATEVSRICAEHTLAIKRLVHRASMDEVAAKLPRGQLRQSWAGRAQASSGSASARQKRSRRISLTTNIFS